MMNYNTSGAGSSSTEGSQKKGGEMSPTFALDDAVGILPHNGTCCLIGILCCWNVV